MKLNLKSIGLLGTMNVGGSNMGLRAFYLFDGNAEREAGLQWRHSVVE